MAATVDCSYTKIIHSSTTSFALMGQRVWSTGHRNLHGLGGMCSHITCTRRTGRHSQDV